MWTEKWSGFSYQKNYTCPGTFSHVSPCYNTRVFYLVCVYQQICFAVSSSQLSTNTLLPQEKGLILEK